MLNDCDVANLWALLRKTVDLITEFAAEMKKCLPGADEWYDHAHPAPPPPVVPTLPQPGTPIIPGRVVR